MSYLRPDGTVDAGNWRTQASGTDLHAVIEETSADDADYIVSPENPVNESCRVSLSNPGAGAISAGTLRYRYWKSGTATVDLQVKLMQSTTEVASWDHSDIGTTPTTASQTLSGGELASISDVNALELVFVANPDSSESMPEVLTTVTEDATRDYYNGTLELSWETQLGNWIDTADVDRGSSAYATQTPTAAADGDTVDFNVLSLIQNYPARFFVQQVGGTAFFWHSREATNAAFRPKLIIDGGTAIECSMDVHFDISTVSSVGDDNTLTNSFVLHFDQVAVPGATTAVLRLKIQDRFSSTPTYNIFRPNAYPDLPTSPAPADGVAGDIVLHKGADTGDGVGASWALSGEDVGDSGNTASTTYTVNGDNSLTCTTNEGFDTGCERIYSIPEADRASTMFSRTIMRIHPEFIPLIGGKFPGLCNTGQTYGAADPVGWGGRTANGTQWSCRTNRWPHQPSNPFSADWMGWSPYAYRLNREGFNGEGPSCHKPLPVGTYFCLDQMIELNTVGNADGRCTYWLDGVCVLDFNDVEWVDTTDPETYVSEYWLNVYVGGVGYEAPVDMDVTFHAVQVSTKRLPFDQSLIDTLNA